MSDYIADRLHLLRDELEDRAFTKALSTGVPDFTARAIRDVREDLAELDGRELYAFARSALNAAADLRIDTPERLDRLSAAVLETPRRLFIETHGPDRSLVAGILRGFLPATAQSRDGQGAWSGKRSASQPTAQASEEIDGYGERWGVFIDILGGGKARFRSVYTRPMLWMRKSATYRDLDTMIETLPKPMRAATRRAFAFDVSPHWFQIDMGRHVGMSRQEFGTTLARMGPGVDPILDNAREKLLGVSTAREKTSIVDAAWRLSRFRDLIRQEPLTGDQQNSVMRQISTSLMSHKALSLPDGVTLIALLAVLEAESSDIRKTPREKKMRGSRAARKTRDRRPATFAEGPSVVTLNIEDRDLADIYERGHTQADGGYAQRSGDTAGRTRHPVRGHLFLGRGGKLVWRKPHWRGSLDRAQIRRVIAPSH